MILFFLMLISIFLSVYSVMKIYSEDRYRRWYSVLSKLPEVNEMVLVFSERTREYGVGLVQIKMPGIIIFKSTIESVVVTHWKRIEKIKI